MTKFRKLGRPGAHRVSMLRSFSSAPSPIPLFRLVSRTNTLIPVSPCRTMVSQLVKHERIETTVAKDDLLLLVRCRPWSQAKEVRRLADNMVQLGKEGTLHAARHAAAFVRGDDVLHKLFTELAYRYKDRVGGYTRLLRTRIRMGDAAPMAYIEFVDRENELREAKTPKPQPPERVPLDPWTKSRASQQWASPKENANSGSES
ncbi:50S ribosomal protein [Musa troglodytarum]|uniref:50S ribosomal protein n=1 Tax=Musa troglodytarum TaxID=320322 RepID=A0A9E7I340_9LILI|nr:50S ribosomal protein [Musa troglodytarum]